MVQDLGWRILDQRRADARLCLFFMPPTLKKLIGHIAFGACVRKWVRGWVTLFVPTVTFKLLKLES